MFSLFVTDANDPNQAGMNSKLLIGGYDLDKYAKVGESISWNPLTSLSYWAVRLVTAKLKSPSDSTAFDLEPSSYVAIVDSGTSYTLLPVNDHMKLRNRL